MSDQETINKIGKTPMSNFLVLNTPSKTYVLIVLLVSLTACTFDAILSFNNSEPLATFSEMQGVTSIAIHPTQTKIAVSGGVTCYIYIWDIQEETMLSEYSLCDGRITPQTAGSIEYSPNGNELAIGGLDSLQIIDANSGTTRFASTIQSASILDIAWGVDGSVLATASNDGLVRIWSVSSGELLNTGYGHQNAVNSVAFSPGGKFLTSVGDDMTIRVWNLSTMDEILQLIGHLDTINSVVYSQDGNTILTAGNDGWVIEWDVTTGLELTRYRTEGRTYDAVYAGDEQYIVTGEWFIDEITIFARVSNEVLSTIYHREDEHGHLDFVEFIPKQNIIVSGAGSSIKLWSLSELIGP